MLVRTDDTTTQQQAISFRLPIFVADTWTHTYRPPGHPSGETDTWEQGGDGEGGATLGIDNNYRASTAAFSFIGNWGSVIGGNVASDTGAFSFVFTKNSPGDVATCEVQFTGTLIAGETEDTYTNEPVGTLIVNQAVDHYPDEFGGFVAFYTAYYLGDLEVTCTSFCPCRLFAEIETVNRVGDDFQWWGRTAKEQPCDVRDYDNCQLDWYYWPPNGAGTTQLVVAGGGLTCNGSGASRAVGGSVSWVVSAIGITIPVVGSGYFEMVGFDFKTFGQSPKQTTKTDTFVFVDTDGDQVAETYTITEDGFKSKFQKLVGDYATIAYMRCSGTFRDPQRLLFNLNAYNATFSNVPANTLKATPIDGPFKSIGLGDNRRKVTWYLPDDGTVSVPLEVRNGVAYNSGHLRAYSINFEARGIGSTVYSSFGADQRMEYEDFAPGSGNIAIGFAYDTTSLHNAGFSPYAWRVPISVAPLGSWIAFRINYNTVQTVDAGGSTSGWSASGGSVSVSSSKLLVTGSSGKAIEKTFSTPQFNLAGYLMFNCYTTGAGGQTGRLVEVDTGKYWDFEIPASDAEIVVPLCASDGSSPDYSNTRFERAFSGGAASISQGGWGWGVESPCTLKFVFNSDDDCYIYDLELVPFETHRLLVNECIPPANPADFRVEDVTDMLWGDLEVYAQRGLVAWADNRVAFDEAIGYITDHPLGKVIDAISIPDLTDEIVARGSGCMSISDIASDAIASANNLPGTSTPYMTLAEFNLNWHPAYRLALQFVVADDYDTPIDVFGQFTVDRLEFGPGTIGLYNWFSARAHGGGYQGVVADGNVLVTNAIVEAKQGALTIDDTRTNAVGYYDLPHKSPSVKIGPEYDLVPQEDDTKKGSKTNRSGVLERISLRGNASVSSEGEGLSTAKSLTGTVYRAFGQAGGIWLEKFTTALLSFGGAARKFDGKNPAIIVDEWSRVRTVDIYYQDVSASEIYLRSSSDNGATFGSATLITTGTMPNSTYDSNTGIRYIVYHDSGAIKLRRKFAYAALESAITVVASGAAEETPAIDVLDDRERTLMVSYRDTGGVLQHKTSTDNGASWV